MKSICNKIQSPTYILHSLHKSTENINGKFSNNATTLRSEMYLFHIIHLDLTGFFKNQSSGCVCRQLS